MVYTLQNPRERCRKCGIRYLNGVLHLQKHVTAEHLKIVKCVRLCGRSGMAPSDSRPESVTS